MENDVLQGWNVKAERNKPRHRSLRDTSLQRFCVRPNGPNTETLLGPPAFEIAVEPFRHRPLISELGRNLCNKISWPLAADISSMIRRTSRRLSSFTPKDI